MGEEFTAATLKFWTNRAQRDDTVFAANLSDYVPNLAKYKDKHECSRILKILRDRPKKKVLDLGCGTGRMAHFFSRISESVSAVDFSGPLISLAEKYYSSSENIDFQVCNITEYLKDERYDVIFLGGVLSYLEDDDMQKVLANLKCMLSPGGCIILRDSFYLRKRKILFKKYKKDLADEYSIVYRSRAEFENMMQENGFRKEDENLFGIFPFLGPYHFFFRNVFGVSSGIYSRLSDLYFAVVDPFVPLTGMLVNTGIYKSILYYLNSYQQIHYVYSCDGK